MINYLYLTNKHNKKILSDYVDGLEVTMKTYYPNLRPTSKQKMIDALTNIFYNCSLVVDRKDKRIQMTLRKGFFSKPIQVNGKDCKIPYGYEAIIKSIDMLVDEGYLNICLGGAFVYKNHTDSKGELKKIAVGRTSTIIEPTETMIDLLKGANIVFDLENYNMVVLRDDEKESVPFALTPSLRKTKKMLLAYNKYLLEHTFCDENGEVIGEPLIKRIYNNDFEHNGRFYTESGLIQTMPQQSRKKILIDGSPVTELDISAMHPTIAYSMLDCDLNFDPYNFKLVCDTDEKAIKDFKKSSGDLDYNPHRNLRKLIVLLAFTTSTKESLTFAIAKKLGDDKKLAKTADFKQCSFYGLSNVVVSKCVDTMLELHSSIRLLMFKPDICFQHKDSLFMQELLTLCVEHSLAVVPIHDSVVCKVEDKVIVEELMRKAFKIAFNTDKNLKIKEK